jgi:formylglycine-generating enzyme
MKKYFIMRFEMLPKCFILILLLTGITSHGAAEITEKMPPEASQNQLPSWTEPATGIRFIFIKGDCFLMGSPDSEPSHPGDEYLHRVCLDDFWIAATEVTRSQYNNLMGINIEHQEEADLPVEMVSWFDAEKFAKIMSKNSKSNLLFRLPTEAEWEYSCRAGSSTPFSTGDTITTGQANFNGNFTYNNSAAGIKRGATTRVGSFSANAFGLYDMHGNVWEWCLDWYKKDFYQKSVQNNKLNNPRCCEDSELRYKTIRGGSWYGKPKFLRSANRSRRLPDDVNKVIGFRLVMKKLNSGLAEK